MENKPSDTRRPNASRIYDCLLGGTANELADRRAVAHIQELVPEIGDTVWANRGFLQRAASRIAQLGVDQFLDIGAGLPTQNNTHDVVQTIAPNARVVYVDHDPFAVGHGGTLTTDLDHVSYAHGDLADPAGLLTSPAIQQVIDFSHPIGLLLVAVTHFLPDQADPYGAVAALVDALPEGSYLALSHVTCDRQSPNTVERVAQVYQGANDQLYFRTRVEIAKFFAGLEIIPPYPGVDPDLVHVGLWGADDPDAADSDGSRWGYAAVARKPCNQREVP